MSKEWRHKGGIGWDEKDSEYAHRTWCKNCRHEFYIYIKKGISIKSVIGEVDCPKCGIKQTGAD